MHEYNSRGYNEQGTHWTLFANCQSSDSSDMFSNMFPNEADEEAVKRAISRCNDCPVKATCLNTALKNREQFGIWGGLTTKQRNYKIKYRASRAVLVKVP